MTPAQLDYGLFYFGVLGRGGAEVYRMLLDTARMADREGLKFVSIPERHFHAFGGAFPNPAVVGAAVATLTERIEIRAGSVVGPLADALRIAEEWAVVDLISGGRAAVSLGSGWSVNDFVLARAPAADYARRRELVAAQVEELRHLWRSGAVTRENAAGNEIHVRAFPAPHAAGPPLWLTAGGSDETFKTAGRLGTNVLTHMERQDLGMLSARIAAYRGERSRYGHDPDAGIVTLMQHTLIEGDAARALDAGAAHLKRYIEAALDLEGTVIRGGGASSGGAPVTLVERRSSDEDDQVVARAVSRYLGQASLIGDLNACRARSFEYLAAGVNEIACLVDFIEDEATVGRTVEGIAALGRSMTAAALSEASHAMIDRFNAVGDR